ncbi:MAG: protein kinase [Eubacterium sp.]|nr:protein kinase [Eubacterium sp.]
MSRQVISPGTVIHERYKIEEQISSGGFSITYKAIDQQSELCVAIKQFSPADTSLDFEHEKDRFLREGNVLREVDYLEGLVAVRDIFEEMDTAFLVEDFVEGITLRKYISQYGTFSWDDLIKLVTPVVKSCTKIHRRGIIHSDISPDNMIIGLDNKLYLIDFGAAQRINSRSERTVIVKSGYTPIEQYYSDGSISDGRIGPWTDVYSFAATLYLALTGNKPRDSVERLSENGKLGQDITKEEQCLSAVLSPWQVDVILRGMAIKKSDRYSDMEQFCEALLFGNNASNTDDMTRVVRKNKSVSKRNNFILGFLICAMLITMLMTGYHFRDKFNYKSSQNVQTTTTEEKSVSEDKSKMVESESKSENKSNSLDSSKNNSKNEVTTEEKTTAIKNEIKESSPSTETTDSTTYNNDIASEPDNSIAEDPTTEDFLEDDTSQPDSYSETDSEKNDESSDQDDGRLNQDDGRLNQDDGRLNQD